MAAHRREKTRGAAFGPVVEPDGKSLVYLKFEGQGSKWLNPLCSSTLEQPTVPQDGKKKIAITRSRFKDSDVVFFNGLRPK